MTATAAGSDRRGHTGRAFSAFVVLLAALAVGLGVRSPDAGASSLPANAACSGADDPAATQAVQRDAIVCLVNAARAQAARQVLTTAPKLRRAAALKGRVVVTCGQVSHTPCGSDPTAPLRAAGYRYGWFGENLWFGTWGHFSARQVVESWLLSPVHKANVLRPGFQHVGLARVRATGVFGEASTAVWVATFASPR